MEYCDPCAEKLEAAFGLPASRSLGKSPVRLTSYLKRRGRCEACGMERVLVQGVPAAEAEKYAYFGTEGGNADYGRRRA
jgi:hypothetical protein